MRYNIGMYIRRISRTNKDGSVVTYVQLAHNVWDSKVKQARARVLFSFRMRRPAFAVSYSPCSGENL